MPSSAFLARDSMCLVRYMLSPVRPSVCLSVTHCISQKRLKLGYDMKFPPYAAVAPSLWFFAGKFKPEILMDSPRGASNKRGVGKTSHFPALNTNISKTVGDSPKLLLMTNRKSHVHFRLTLRSMSLDDLELLQVRILRPSCIVSDSVVTQ